MDNNWNFYNGENYESFMRRVVPIMDRSDPEQLMNETPILRGLVEHLASIGHPLSEVAIKILALEMCGVIAYNQLEVFFENSVDSSKYTIRSEFLKKADEIRSSI